MEFGKIFGLPAHPLLVHIPVIGIPFVALLAIAFVLVPRWRDGLLYPLAGLTAFVTVATVMVAGSGEKLEEMLPAEDRKSAALRHHTSLGDQTEWLMVVFGVVTLALLAIYWYRRRQARAGAADTGPRALAKAVLPLGIAAIVLGALTTVWDVRAGHAGAKSVWNDAVPAGQTVADKGDGDGDAD